MRRVAIQRLLVTFILAVFVLVGLSPARSVRADRSPVLSLSAESQAWASAWLAINPGETLVLTHNLAGEVEDYAVQLWFLDTEPGGLGVHTRGYGGLVLDGQSTGAALQNLTSTTVAVHRFANDVLVDRIRVAIWVAEDPSRACSGWMDIAPGDIETFSPHIGDDTDDLTVSLGFRELEPGTGLGIHQWGFGGEHDGANYTGAYWLWLSTAGVSVYRGLHDSYIDQVHICITSPEQQPDYDSGWRAVDKGTSLTLTHDLGGYLTRYSVRMDCRDLIDGVVDGLEINNAGFGGTAIPSGESHFDHGHHWENLTTSSIEGVRQSSDAYCDEIRLRIWTRRLNTVFLPVALRLD